MRRNDVGSSADDSIDRTLVATGQQLDGQDLSSRRFLAGKLRRHVQWVRTEGLAKVIEEDQLNPVPRISASMAKRRWQRRAGRPPGSGRAVFVLGLQRSGTNMVLRGVERSPQTEVHNENDSQVFRRYRLVDAAVEPVLANSRAAAVLFKPLCDSHRAIHLLEGLRLSEPRAVWIYRNVDDRVRSAIAKFGPHDLAVVQAIARGRGDRLWQAGGLDDTQLSVLRSLDVEALSPESASALFWWMRNSLYFTLGLSERTDVALVSYDDVVARPEAAMSELCEHLGIDFSAELVRHIDSRTGGPTRLLPVDPTVRALCDDLKRRLDECVRRSARARSVEAASEILRHG